MASVVRATRRRNSRSGQTHLRTLAVNVCAGASGPPRNAPAVRSVVHVPAAICASSSVVVSFGPSSPSWLSVAVSSAWTSWCSTFVVSPSNRMPDASVAAVRSRRSSKRSPAGSGGGVTVSGSSEPSGACPADAGELERPLRNPYTRMSTAIAVATPVGVSRTAGISRMPYTGAGITPGTRTNSSATERQARPAPPNSRALFSLLICRPPQLPRAGRPPFLPVILVHSPGLARRTRRRETHE